MIEIDGSGGHGGGQIVRTAVALSAVTGKTFKICNIRAKRPAPGLKPQHLESVKAIAELCGAETTGAEPGSTSLEFVPGKLRCKDLKIDTGTAGSISLVLQALLIPCSFCEKPVKLKIIGGTDVKWSPPTDYMTTVTLPLMKRFGFEAEMKTEERGYYPKGGGLIEAKISPAKPAGSELLEKGELISINGISHASQDLEKAGVAERQAAAARKALAFMGVTPEIKTEYNETASTGSGINLWLETDNSVLGANALGERGKPAENVGKEAAEKLVGQYEQGSIDRWSADQLIPFMALAGDSAIKASEISGHCESNIAIVEKFTDKRFIVKEKIIKVR